MRLKCVVNNIDVCVLSAWLMNWLRVVLFFFQNPRSKFPAKPGKGNGFVIVEILLPTKLLPKILIPAFLSFF
jgi:hypothetical protein